MAPTTLSTWRRVMSPVQGPVATESSLLPKPVPGRRGRGALLFAAVTDDPPGAGTVGARTGSDRSGRGPTVLRAAGSGAGPDAASKES
ncbi:hypothetical protein [Nocardia flavorosea]|uniref:Uncharacterized protein n=1 Tax=Nocardia flavorosea TaxID=53429 RepID=A0A846YFT1_9NOCA|nr:hypothetical protein [Nocardia flavorosea]NKY56711.1 hypothetical protein [Nocardia flavorosea]